MAYSTSALRAGWGRSPCRSVWVLIFEIDGWRQNLVAQSQDGNAGFQASGAAQQMSGHRLGGTYWQRALEAVANGVGFKRVADRSRCAVRIHVAHDFRA